jgi:bacteriorhodopsin
MAETVLQTAYLSLGFQALTGLVGLYGLKVELPPKDQALKVSLQIEMVVQLIEFVFYLWAIFRFNLATMAASRYADWVVTTPLMLISLMLYFDYEQAREEGRDTTTVVRDFWKTHRDTVATVVAANFLMVALGYAGEVGWLPPGLSVVLGFGAFGTAFYTLWERLASKSCTGRRLFKLIATVWSLYGAAFLLPTASKNIVYNGLDVVAKNFFGVFLASKVIQARSTNERRSLAQPLLLEHGMTLGYIPLVDVSRIEQESVAFRVKR